MVNETLKIDEMEWAKRFFLERKIDVLILVAGIFLGVFLKWDIVEIAVFSVLVWAIVGPISVRILAAAALFFLSVTPFLLMLDREDQAEQYAVYAYYFLVIAVIRGILDLKGEKQTDKSESLSSL
ncbi:MAG: hypothetical protein HGA31_03040 [Candidatus Moranbacteria bacterium]|nr:hypothetical protein [Candidatus Moranbacteria bacterium]